jgi:hypothetical protein
MKLTEGEQRVLKVLAMMRANAGILIPDEQAFADRALQRLCKKAFVEKRAEREGFHRYKLTESGMGLLAAPAQS